MDSGRPFSLFSERHLRAKNLSDGTVASYLVGVRQFTAFLSAASRVRGGDPRPREAHRAYLPADRL